MTEQELADNKFRADMENALHQNRSLTMIAQTIWELSKAYADAREKELKEVAMKYLESRNEFARQLVELRREWEDKDTEIAELKSQLDRASEVYADLVMGMPETTRHLLAEIKRLREVAQRARQYCEYGNGCGGATKLPSGEWFDEGEGTLYHAVLSVLSPAPVTEGKENEVTRETMMKALLDIEDDAHAKMVLGTPLNTKSILMSARHGLGIDSEMIHPLNEDQK